MPLVARIFGLAFAGAAVAFVYGAWSSGAPLPFLLFAGCIALACAAVGLGIASGKVMPRHGGLGRAGGRYRCRTCAAPLAKGADVSPSGDAKCAHCGNWFNVHRQF